MSRPPYAEEKWSRTRHGEKWRTHLYNRGASVYRHVALLLTPPVLLQHSSVPLVALNACKALPSPFIGRITPQDLVLAVLARILTIWAGVLCASGTLSGWLLTVNSEGALRLSKRLLTMAVSAATATVLDGVALTRAALFVACILLARCCFHASSMPMRGYPLRSIGRASGLVSLSSSAAERSAVIDASCGKLCRDSGTSSSTFHVFSN